MPGGDRMGPMGMGPMTGRAGGQSEGSPMPGFVGTYGRGGRGFGRGRGSRRRRNRLRATGWTGLQEGRPPACLRLETVRKLRLRKRAPILLPTRGSSRHSAFSSPRHNDMPLGLNR